MLGFPWRRSWRRGKRSEQGQTDGRVPRARTLQLVAGEFRAPNEVTSLGQLLEACADPGVAPAPSALEVAARETLGLPVSPVEQVVKVDVRPEMVEGYVFDKGERNTHKGERLALSVRG